MICAINSLLLARGPFTCSRRAELEQVPAQHSLGILFSDFTIVALFGEDKKAQTGLTPWGLCFAVLVWCHPPDVPTVTVPSHSPQSL